MLATGEPKHVSGEVISMSVQHGAMAPVMEVRIVRLFDGVVIAWRRVDEVERLAALLQHAQRIGHIGGWEENLLTGDVHWTDRTFALFGRQPGDPVPVADLHSHVQADDIAGVERFRGTLLTEHRATAAVFRIIRAEDQSVRQIRAFAEPVMDLAGTLVALRGAYQDVSADYHTQVAFAATRDQLADTEERAEEERILALRLQQAITPGPRSRWRWPVWRSPRGTGPPGPGTWWAATGMTRSHCRAARCSWSSGMSPGTG